jgi:hypothetical protein
LFLGSFGLHRFYLRQRWGVVYLLFGLLGFAYPSLFAVLVPITIAESLYFFWTGAAKWNERFGGGSEVAGASTDSAASWPSGSASPAGRPVSKASFAQECSHCAKKLSLAEQTERTGQCARCTLREKGLMIPEEEVVFW